MRNFSLAILAAVMVSAPAAAENTLTLICKCQNVVVNSERRSCRGQSDRTATIDLDKSTLQWSNGAGLVWPAIPASISADAIQAAIDPAKPRFIPGRLEISSYAINRITGQFEEDGMGHYTHPLTPNVDSLVPADVNGLCTKADAPKF